MIQVTKIQIPGLETQKPRRLYVYTPRGYRGSDRRYPVLYMFDGHNVFYDSHATYGKSWGMKEYLEKTGLPLILVAVECNPEGNRRILEYSPWSFTARGFGHVEGLGRKTMDWFTGCLKPEIDRTYRTLPDREHTMIAGSSMGGLMTLWAAVEYNQFFSRAAALSPSLWVGRREFPQLIKERPLADPTWIYMDMGTAEEPEDRGPVMRRVFNTARDLVLAGASVACRAVPGAVHNEAAWEQRIPVFMEYLFKDMD